MMKHYIGMGCQLMGMAMVGLCLAIGLGKGDYSKMELFQFIGGSVIFTLGHFLRL